LQRSQKFANPFYGLLLVTGIMFALTAICYGLMAFREARPLAADQPAAPKHPLVEWMSRNGEMALMSELAFLAAFTFAAIGTDDFWQRKNTQR
jgi:hypothetical protein